MNPRRAWIAIAALAAALLVAVLALATYLEGRPRSRGYRGVDVWKIDAHEIAEPGTLLVAMSLASSQGIVGIVNYAGGHVGGGLEEQISAASRFPGRVAIFMELDLEGCCGEAWSDRELVRMVQGRAAGARGLRIPRALGLEVRDARGERVPVDAPELESVWDMAWRLEIPVAIHAGDPKAFFRPVDEANERREELALLPGSSLADRSRYPDWQTVFDEFVRVVERHPKLDFIGVHFGNDAEDPAEVSRLLERLPNLYVDTAARLPELGKRADATRAAILAHPDRVLFGTNLQWIANPTSVERAAVILGAGAPATSMEEVRRFFQSTWRFFETRDDAIPSPTPIQGRSAIQGLGLPPPVLEKVYHGNAQRLLGFGSLGRD